MDLFGVSSSTSPVSTVPEPVASTSRPQRSTRTVASYASSSREDTSSPSPPSRSAAMSTRSRRSLSSSLSHPERSPDKRSTSSRESRRAKERSPIKGLGVSEAALGIILGDAEDSQDGAAQEAVHLHEEGEEEVEDDTGQNGMMANEVDDAELEAASIDSQRDSEYTPSRKRRISPEKEKLTDSNKKVIRLVFGKKRKAEDEADKPEESEQEEDLLEQEEMVGTETEAPVMKVVAAQTTKTLVEEMRGGLPKRMPRKKRKWLKKGEVDPDDPVAVARQRERHRLIDEAIENLDKQEEMLLASSHPQLVWLWDELEKRKDTQLTWLEARHDATIGDLERLQEHEKKVTMSNFKVKRERLAMDMLTENRHAVERMFAERTMLKRNSGNRPSLRGGRGAGGWPIAATDLLSNGELRTLNIQINDETRARRDISRDLQPLEYNDVQSDLAKLGLLPESSGARSPSPQRPRQSSTTHSRPAERRKSTAHSRRHEQPVTAPPKQVPAPNRPPTHWEQREQPLPQHPPPKPPAIRARSPDPRAMTFMPVTETQFHNRYADTNYDPPPYALPANNAPSKRDRAPVIPQPKQRSHPPGRSDGAADYRYQHSLAYPGGPILPPMPNASTTPNFYHSHPRSVAVPPHSIGVPPQA
ncbi:hypothetical protein IAT40_004351 [Kwoniella sp. CBS 6097]